MQGEICLYSFFDLIKHSLDPEKFALKDGGNWRSWVYMSIFLRPVVGTRERQMRQTYVVGRVLWRAWDIWDARCSCWKDRGERAVLCWGGIELWVRPDKSWPAYWEAVEKCCLLGLISWRRLPWSNPQSSVALPWDRTEAWQQESHLCPTEHKSFLEEIKRQSILTPTK